MSKNTTNHDQYPNKDKIESKEGFKRAHMKQMERIENVLLAILDRLERGPEPVSVNSVIQAVQDNVTDIKDDLLDDGKRNHSNRRGKKKE